MAAREVPPPSGSNTSHSGHTVGDGRVCAALRAIGSDDGAAGTDPNLTVDRLQLAAAKQTLDLDCSWMRFRAGLGRRVVLQARWCLRNK